MLQPKNTLTCKIFSKSGNNTILTETYRSCLDKRELLVCKINHDQVSAEQILGLTKIRLNLLLMLINHIAPKLTVPNSTVIPKGAGVEHVKTSANSYNYNYQIFFAI